MAAGGPWQGQHTPGPPYVPPPAPGGRGRGARGAKGAGGPGRSPMSELGAIFNRQIFFFFTLKLFSFTIIDDCDIMSGSWHAGKSLFLFDTKLHL